LALAIVGLFLVTKNLAFVTVIPLIILALHVVAANQVRERAERAAWQKWPRHRRIQRDRSRLRPGLGGRPGRELFSSDQVDVEVRPLPYPPGWSVVTPPDAV